MINHTFNHTLTYVRYTFCSSSMGGDDPKPIRIHTKTTFLGVDSESVWSSTPTIEQEVYRNVSAFV